MSLIRLGLIGDAIAASHAPRLHETAGRLLGLDVRYERLVPAALGLEAEAVFDGARAEGFRGLNITYPYKERLAARTAPGSAAVAGLGAVNTVLFEPDGPVGWNTDHSGARTALTQGLDGAPLGDVILLGAGGVGRAFAFAVAELGAASLLLVDRAPDRAEALAAALKAVNPSLPIETAASVDPVRLGAADGLINATPIGMTEKPGAPVPLDALGAAGWAFDAIYTPRETAFLAAARAAGRRCIDGYELFLWQGVDAVRLFTGHPIDAGRLREALAASG